MNLMSSASQYQRAFRASNWFLAQGLALPKDDDEHVVAQQQQPSNEMDGMMTTADDSCPEPYSNTISSNEVGLVEDVVDDDTISRQSSIEDDLSINSGMELMTIRSEAGSDDTSSLSSSAGAKPMFFQRKIYKCEILVRKYLRFLLLVLIHHNLVYQDNSNDKYFVKEIKNKVNSSVPQVYPDDSDAPFDPTDTSPDRKTKQDAAIELYEGFIKHNSSETQINDMLNVMHNLTPRLNLPLRTESKVASKIYPNNIRSYVPRDDRDVKIDICRVGCTAFHGVRPHEGKDEDFGKMLYCPAAKCQAQRFASKCKKCKNKRYDQCNPFKPGPNGVKPQHGVNSRVPAATAYYRPITPKLIDMFLKSIGQPGLGNLLKYHLPENRVHRDGSIIDICDGADMKTEMEKMEAMHTTRAAAYMAEHGHELLSCALMLTLFYDGKMNFKRKADSMWPLLCSIVNCNPSHRSRLGAGLFLTLLHNMADTPAEKYLTDELLVQELKALEAGMVLVVRCEGEPDKHVFLQARVVYAHVDTRALESVAKIKGAGSKCGCVLCNMQSGLYVKNFKKCIYSGTRNALPLNHALRKMGKKTFLRREVEEEYYAGGAVAKSIYAASVERVKLISEAAAKDMKTLKYFDSFRRYEDKDLPLPVSAAMEHDEEPRLWFNCLFGIEMFIDKLYYPFTDMRDQRFYERLSNAKYIINGEAAEKKSREYEASLLARNGVRSKTKKDNSVNGVHGVSSLVRELDGMSFERFGPDFMHYIANAVKYTILMWKGERGLNDASRKLSIGLDKFPELKFKKKLASWQLSQLEQDTVDAVMRGMTCPPAYTVDHNFKQPMKQTGFMKFRDLLNFMLSCASYTLSFTSQSIEYQNFTARFAFDLCTVLNPIISVAELEEEIIWSVYETRGIQEGLIPDSELVFIFHQIIDIVHHILRCGHIRSLTCYSGERALSTIAAHVTRGGVHYIKTLYYRYIAKERLMEKDLSVNPEYIDNSGKYSDIALKLLGKSTVSVLNVEQLDELYQQAFEFLRAETLSSVYNQSPFYRLYKAYVASCSLLPTSAALRSFCGWLRAVRQICKENSEDMNIKFYDSELFEALIAVPMEYRYSASCSDDTLSGFFMKDFNLLLDELLKFTPHIHEKVIVKGIVIKCRGAAAVNDDLYMHYHEKRQHAAFVRFTDTRCVTRERTKNARPREVVSYSLKGHNKPAVDIEAASSHRPSSSSSSSSSLAALDSNAADISKKTKRDVAVRVQQVRPANEYSRVFSTKPTLAPIPAASVPDKNIAKGGKKTSAKSDVTAGMMNESEAIVGELDQQSAALSQPTMPSGIAPLVTGIHHKNAEFVRGGAVVDDRGVTRKTKFGQLDYCFRINLPSDPIVHGLAIGALKVIDTVYCLKRRHHFVDCTEHNALHGSRTSFVCLNHVDSTAIRVSALDAQHKPIMPPGSKDTQNIGDTYWAGIFAARGSPVRQLFFIEAHPERLTVRYSSIDIDKDGTRIFESSAGYKLR